MSTSQPSATDAVDPNFPWPTVGAFVANAYHEAGHAVAAFALGIPVKRVSIVPNSKCGSAGHVRLGKCRSVDMMHKQGIVAMAGEAGQRIYGHGWRRYHESSDRQAVADYALEHTGSEKQATLLVRLWELQARDLVEKQLSSVHLVTNALMKHWALNAAQVRMILFRIPGAEDKAGHA